MSEYPDSEEFDYLKKAASYYLSRTTMLQTIMLSSVSSLELKKGDKESVMDALEDEFSRIMDDLYYLPVPDQDIGKFKEMFSKNIETFRALLD